MFSIYTIILYSRFEFYFTWYYTYVVLNPEQMYLWLKSRFVSFAISRLYAHSNCFLSRLISSEFLSIWSFSVFFLIVHSIFLIIFFISHLFSLYFHFRSLFSFLFLTCPFSFALSHSFLCFYWIAPSLSCRHSISSVFSVTCYHPLFIIRVCIFILSCLLRRPLFNISSHLVFLICFFQVGSSSIFHYNIRHYIS